MLSEILKKPKLDQNGGSVYKVDHETIADEVDRREESNMREQEEALIALIEHRTREVFHLRQRITYYKSQLQEAEKRLDHTQAQLARLRGKSESAVSNSSQETEAISNNVSPPTRADENVSKDQPYIKSEVDTISIPEVSRTPKLSVHSATQAPASSFSNGITEVKTEKYDECFGDDETTEFQRKKEKRKLEQREQDLVPLLRSASTPCLIRCHASNHISSQHKRKLRSLALCPMNYQLFVTSALDGVVNLWQIQSQGSGASLLSTTEFMSPKHRKWPEDVAWHPSGDRLFSVYSADGGDSQIGILDLNNTHGKSRVMFLENKPHTKGIINDIEFLPWEGTCFVTGGSDHAVVLWNENESDRSWKPKVLHRHLHSSAVMGVAGLLHKPITLSAGADKRVIGFDTQTEKASFWYQVDSKCMNVLPNPCDLNLIMVQTGMPEQQLRLFDVRIRQREVHTFGFKQESSDSQSALINQSWSPDGLYLTSGSVDPVIHIFDIRFNSNKPSQSIKAHQKRVFKAVWHYNLPLLISISSDLHIGLHKISASK